MGARDAAILYAALLVAAAFCAGGCAHTPPAGHLGDLAPGELVEADLDGDGFPEQVLLDASDGSVAITDGEVFYRSRERWHVVQATLGDTDHDGLPEIVALVDSDNGRHVALFAYFGGVYRERLVTQPIDPAPQRLRIVTREQDLVELTQPTRHDGGVLQTLLLRWNGLGFTLIETETVES